MSRQTELMALSESKGQKRYRFYLQNTSKGLLSLRYSPSGWEQAKYKIERNPRYMGLFRTISVNELIFVKDARDFIRDVYEGQGINAEIIFTVQRLNAAHTYVDYYVGKVDLSTYQINETGVKVGIIDNTITEKVKNRENLKVNLRNTISVNGYGVIPFADEPARVEFPAFVIRANAAWTENADIDTSDASHYLPMLEGLTEFDETQSQTITGTDPFFSASTANRILHLTGEIEGLVICNEEAATVHINIRLMVNGISVATLLTKSGSWVEDLPFSGTFDETFSIIIGDLVSIQTTITGAVSAPDTIYNVINVQLQEDFDNVAVSSGIAYQYYEAFLRCLQIITDSDDPLQSTFFGRTDTPVVTYSNDGQLGSITRGLLIRDAAAYNETLSISFADLFDAMNKLFMLGMGVEEISGTDKVVIEALTYFFQETVVCDLSGRLREDAITKEVLPEWHYSRVKVGYNSFDYPEVTANEVLQNTGELLEFNTKSEFSTVISALDNELDLLCKFRADTMGMIALRKAGPVSDSEKGDEDIFIVDTVRKVSSPWWTARTDEDFIFVGGGIDATQWYNLDLSPKRNLLRHGLKLRAGLEHNLSSYIRWQYTDKNTGLCTQRTAEPEKIYEVTDVQTNDLYEPMWHPEAYDVELNFTDADLQAILINPRGLIKLSQTKFGWLLSLEAGSKEKKAHLRLLRCNLNYVTPIES